MHPAWVTAAGSLGSFAAGGASIGTINLTATDSTGMTFAVTTGALPGGV